VRVTGALPYDLTGVVDRLPAQVVVPLDGVEGAETR
jgi:hypothetical protein